MKKKKRAMTDHGCLGGKRAWDGPLYSSMNLDLPTSNPV